MLGGGLAGAPDSEQYSVVCYPDRNDNDIMSGESRDRRGCFARSRGGVKVWALVLWKVPVGVLYLRGESRNNAKVRRKLLLLWPCQQWLAIKTNECVRVCAQVAEAVPWLFCVRS